LSKYEQEGLVPFVVDAVYSMAHAIHNLLRDRCGERWSKSCFKEFIKGADLLAYIRNVSFKSKITLEIIKIFLFENLINSDSKSVPLLKILRDIRVE
jgi:hypothetical protein